MYKVLFHLFGSADEVFTQWLEQTVERIIDFLENSEMNDLFGSEDREQIVSGEPTESRLELYAAANIFDVIIQIDEIDENCALLETSVFKNRDENPTTIYLVVNGSLFACRDTGDTEETTEEITEETTEETTEEQDVVVD